MKNKIKKQFIWVPRILIIFYILFLSLFALDTEFGLGFFMHLIPSFVLIAILIFAWKKQKPAGILFLVAGVITIIFYNTYQGLISFLTISLPPILAGILFLVIKSKK